MRTLQERQLSQIMKTEIGAFAKDANCVRGISLAFVLLLVTACNDFNNGTECFSNKDCDPGGVCSNGRCEYKEAATDTVLRTLDSPISGDDTDMQTDSILDITNSPHSTGMHTDTICTETGTETNNARGTDTAVVTDTGIGPNRATDTAVVTTDTGIGPNRATDTAVVSDTIGEIETDVDTATETNTNLDTDTGLMGATEGFTDTIGVLDVDAGLETDCGNGTVDDGESCDDGDNNGFTDHCNLLCSAQCEDGVDGCFESLSGVLACDGGVITWDTVQKYYAIVGNVLVPEECTLNIEPGVEVRYGGDFYIQVDGTLSAIGTAEKKITFRASSTRPSTNGLAMIRATNDASIVQIDNARFLGNSAVKCVENWVGVSVTNSRFVGCLHAILATSGEIMNNTISDSFIGIYIETYISPLTISRNRISNTDSAIAVYWSYDGSTLIENNEIVDNIRGLDCSGTCADLTLTHNHFENNLIDMNEFPYRSTMTYNNFLSTVPGVGFDHITPVLRHQTVLHHNNIVPNNTGDYILLSTYEIPSSDDDEPIDVTQNYWGEALSLEMAQKGAGANISAFYDYHDDFNYNEIIYDNWLTEPEPLAGIQHEE